jgi:hypothetical protein
MITGRQPQEDYIVSEEPSEILPSAKELKHGSKKHAIEAISFLVLLPSVCSVVLYRIYYRVCIFMQITVFPYKTTLFVLAAVETFLFALVVGLKGF